MQREMCLMTCLLLPVAAGAGCSDGNDGSSVDVVLEVAAEFAGAAVSCGEPVDGLGMSAATARLADARLFVSGVELRTPAGDYVPLALEQDGVWQLDDIVLLDFEDGTGACADSGTADVNRAIVGSAPAGEYTGVRFDVGLPFERNHLDTATAPAPLNAPGMFWVWQSGYKFLRVDYLVEGGSVPRWNVHLGATGCESDAPTQAPDEPCARSNRPTIAVDGFDPLTDGLVVDLAALVSQSDLLSNVADSPPGCMSNPAEADDCSGVFSALGLDFSDGSCDGDCAGQSVFGAAEL